MNTLGPEKNFLGLHTEDSSLDTARVVVLPVPYERTSSYGKGCCLGPEAIINASPQLEFYDEELDVEIHRLCKGIATADPLVFDEHEQGAEAIGKVYRAVQVLLEKQKFVVCLGGEHTCALGPLRAHYEKYGPCLTVLHMDAHSDLRDQYLGNPFSHASVMARALEILPDIVQVGIRSQDIEEKRRIHGGTVRTFYAHAIKKAQASDWHAKVIGAMQDRVYITIDCDFFDPSIVPAVGTPEPGGFHWDETLEFLRKVTREREVVGFDLCEFAPIEGMIYPNFTMARLVYKLLGYCFSRR